jgi:predicted 3-demethylubiquinone-9 3-methyltransferase (glyoxalase superfamily)
MVNCETQGKWTSSGNGCPRAGNRPCGWLKDRYGLSWQIVPTALGQMLRDEDSKRAYAQ